MGLWEGWKDFVGRIERVPLVGEKGDREKGWKGDHWRLRGMEGVHKVLGAVEGIPITMGMGDMERVQWEFGEQEEGGAMDSIQRYGRITIGGMDVPCD